MMASAEACRQIEAQFLDQTASLEKIRLARKQNGKLTIHRTYTFDFSRDRESRQKGHVNMIGQTVTQVFLDHDSGTTLL